MSDRVLQWSDLAFSSKRPLRDLDAIFIAAPREISPARLTQLVKEFLPQGNIVFGCAKEKYIDGFEGQPQFKTLQIEELYALVEKVNGSMSPHKITILQYEQRDARSIFDKITFRRVVLVNGSWMHSFHTRPEYYALVSRHVPLSFVSPFSSEQEAMNYAAAVRPVSHSFKHGAVLTETEMLKVASLSANCSFDSAFQTGVSLGRRTKDQYILLATSYNKVVPYQTFAWHFGPLRERHLSPPGDLNYYDAVHAEVMLLIDAQRNGYDLRDTSLFINLLPCPTCARMFCETDIREFVYARDHSNGYAVALLEKAGKTVRRLVDISDMV